MSEQTEIANTTLNKVLEGGVSEFVVNGEQAQTLPLNQIMAVRNQLTDEAMSLQNNGTGRGVTGAVLE